MDLRETPSILRTSYEAARGEDDFSITTFGNHSHCSEAPPPPPAVLAHHLSEVSASTYPVLLVTKHLVASERPTVGTTLRRHAETSKMPRSVVSQLSLFGPNTEVLEFIHRGGNLVNSPCVYIKKDKCRIEECPERLRGPDM